MTNLLQQQADLINKILKYTHEQELLIHDIRKDLQEYENSLRSFMGVDYAFKDKLGDENE